MLTKFSANPQSARWLHWSWLVALFECTTKPIKFLAKRIFDKAVRLESIYMFAEHPIANSFSFQLFPSLFQCICSLIWVTIITIESFYKCTNGPFATVWQFILLPFCYKSMENKTKKKSYGIQMGPKSFQTKTHLFHKE